MNRREALRTLAAGASAGALAGGMVIMATPSPAAARSELDELIQAHRSANDAWCNACVAIERTQQGTAAHAFAFGNEARLHWQEQEALNSLLAYRPADLAELQARMEYLVGPAGPWEASVPLERELDVFFASMTRGAA